MSLACTHASRTPVLQGWQAVARGAGGGGGAATQGTAPAVGAVAAQCMLVMELTQALPEWNNWLAYDVLFVRSVQGCLLWAQLQL